MISEMHIDIWDLGYRKDSRSINEEEFLELSMCILAAFTG